MFLLGGFDPATFSSTVHSLTTAPQTPNMKNENQNVFTLQRDNIQVYLFFYLLFDFERGKILTYWVKSGKRWYVCIQQLQLLDRHIIIRGFCQLLRRFLPLVLHRFKYDIIFTWIWIRWWIPWNGALWKQNILFYSESPQIPSPPRSRRGVGCVMLVDREIMSSYK
jgi:hypothetical protein